MRAPTSTLWTAAGAIDAQTDLDVKVRLLTSLNPAGQCRQGRQRVSAASLARGQEDIALSLTLSLRARLSLNTLIWAVVTVTNKLA